MVTINYRFSDGHSEDIEVTEEYAAKYAEFAQDEKRRVWRESKRKRREVSLEKLTETGWDIPDTRAEDPQETEVEQERPSILPHLSGLTEYQRRVAIKHFIECKTNTQIAREEKVSQPAISRLLHKAQAKITVSMSGGLSKTAAPSLIV